MRPIQSIRKRILATAILGFAAFCTTLGVEPAVASVADGKAAFHNGDYATAVREFQGPAYKGDVIAQYYLGVLFSDGLGVRQSDVDGLAWFTCAQSGSLPSPLDADVQRRRAGIISALSPGGFYRAEDLAQTLCGVPPLPRYDEIEKIRPRRGQVGSLVFFPGDTIIIGAMVVFNEYGLFTLRDVLAVIVRGFGDVLFGLFALLGWFITVRAIFGLSTVLVSHIFSMRKAAKSVAAAKKGLEPNDEGNDPIGL